MDTMSSSVYFRSAFKISLGTIALFFLLQSHAHAQITVAQPNFHQVQPTLANVSRQDLLRRLIQRILPSASGQEIRLVLKLNQRRVYVYQGNSLIASYLVAVGKTGWQTPTGNFKVIEMLKNPGWTNFKTGKVVLPGENNPLGERWIAFWTDGKDYIGFHGTPDRTTVGRSISHGCVRMYNEDVRNLYKMVTIGTPVIVEP